MRDPVVVSHQDAERNESAPASIVELPDIMEDKSVGGYQKTSQRSESAEDGVVRPSQKEADQGNADPDVNVLWLSIWMVIPHPIEDDVREQERIREVMEDPDCTVWYCFMGKHSRLKKRISYVVTRNTSPLAPFAPAPPS